MSETYADHLARVRGMASGNPTWDLSPNDLAALRAMLARLDAAEADVRRLRDVVGEAIDFCQTCVDRPEPCATCKRWRSVLTEAPCPTT